MSACWNCAAPNAALHCVVPGGRRVLLCDACREKVKHPPTERSAPELIWCAIERGCTYTDIARTLNDEHVPTNVGGAHWDRRTVRNIHQRMQRERLNMPDIIISLQDGTHVATVRLPPPTTGETGWGESMQKVMPEVVDAIQKAYTLERKPE